MAWKGNVGETMHPFLHLALALPAVACLHLGSFELTNGTACMVSTKCSRPAIVLPLKDALWCPPTHPPAGLCAHVYVCVRVCAAHLTAHLGPTTPLQASTPQQARHPPHVLDKPGWRPSDPKRFCAQAPLFQHAVPQHPVCGLVPCSVSVCWTTAHKH